MRLGLMKTIAKIILSIVVFFKNCCIAHFFPTPPSRSDLVVYSINPDLKKIQVPSSCNRWFKIVKLLIVLMHLDDFFRAVRSVGGIKYCI